MSELQSLSIEMLRRKALEYAEQAAAESDYQKRADLERQALNYWQQMRRLGYRIVISPNAQMLLLALLGGFIIPIIAA